MTTTLTHRRQESELSNSSIILFAEDGNENYGDNVWTLETELPRASENKELIEFAAEFYGVDFNEAEELVDPENIVDSAGAWNDEQFVSECWNEFEFTGFCTFDGAVVLDRESVEINYSKEN